MFEDRQGVERAVFPWLNLTVIPSIIDNGMENLGPEDTVS
jgi:hypothetical protein